MIQSNLKLYFLSSTHIELGTGQLYGGENKTVYVFCRYYSIGQIDFQSKSYADGRGGSFIGTFTPSTSETIFKTCQIITMFEIEQHYFKAYVV